MRLFARRPPRAVRIEQRESTAVSTRAWNRYSFALHWVSHAESKATAALTATAFVIVAAVTIAGMSRCVPVVATALVAVVVCLISALQFAIALLPRLRADGTGESSVYFGQIVTDHPLDVGADSFAHKFRLGITDEDLELRELGDQVLANAHIASEKFKWVGRGLRTLVAGIFLLMAATGIWVSVLLLEWLH